MDVAVSQFFESIRNPFLDAVAVFFSLLGEPIFMVVLICVAYWLVSKKLGERLAVISFTSLVVNAGLKSWIGRPRPYMVGDVSRVELEGLVNTMDLRPYESFPSGHSQGVGGIAFGFASHYRKKWLWIVAPIITLCVMWSRVYLGVHYLTDTLCGGAIGIMFAVVWDLVYEQFQDKKYWILAGFSILSILVMIFIPTKSTFEHAGMLIAGTIALPIEEKFIRFTDTNGWKKRALRLLIGVACVGVVFGAFSLLPFAFLELIGWKFVKYFLTVLVATLLVPFLFKKLKI
jgi:membrane-associated phospholipid phosphatase